MDKPHIAIYLDAENLGSWIKNRGVEHLIDELSESGVVTVRKAFGNWNGGIEGFQEYLNRYGFDFEHTYHPVSGKNSADMAMAIEVTEAALTNLDVDWFVLATGDSDFSPLFRKVRSMGRHVIGVGPHSALSESVKTFCEQYFYTDQYQPQRAEDLLNPNNLIGAINLTRKVLEDNPQPMSCSSLKSRLLLMDSRFDEKKHGFKCFSAFLQAIDDVDTRQYGEQNVWCARLVGH